MSGCADAMFRDSGNARGGGRHEQRNAAFVDGLYGTALRLSEWASVVMPGLPRLEAGRSFCICALTDTLLSRIEAGNARYGKALH
jgi:hypothetical protein